MTPSPKAGSGEREKWEPTDEEIDFAVHASDATVRALVRRAAMDRAIEELEAIKSEVVTFDDRGVPERAVYEDVIDARLVALLTEFKGETL